MIMTNKNLVRRQQKFY